jgi:general secretion pathway protein C
MILPLPSLLNNPEKLRQLQNRLPAIISLVLIIACAHVLSQITWMLVAEPDTTQPPATTSKPVKAANKNNRQQEFRQLTNAHIFGAAGQTQTSSSKAPETKLNLVLKGVLAATPMKMASAIISQGKGGKEEIYGIGDKLSGGVKIEEIHADYVVLLRSGRHETLRMPTDSEVFKVDRAGGAKKKSHGRSARGATPGGTLKNIRKEIMKNPTSFAEYALPVIVKEGGKQIGYRLQPQKKGDMLREMGLEPNDVITSINGIKLDQPQNGIGALQKLSTASNINLIVKRNGAEVPINIQLQ